MNIQQLLLHILDSARSLGHDVNLKNYLHHDTVNQHFLRG